MLDHYLGVSKQYFLDHHVVPANDNDAFYNDQCIVCWDSYDDDHPAVRILPCNHIFGHQCLLAMVDAPNGERCPTCRRQLFRPALLALIESWDQAIEDHMTAFMFPIIYKVTGFVDTLPFGLGFLVQLVFAAWMLLYVDLSNPFFYTRLLVKRFTDLRARNQQLKPRANEVAFGKMMFYASLVGRIVSIVITIPFPVKFPTVFIVIMIYDWSRVTTFKDRVIYGVMVLLSLAMGFGLAATSRNMIGLT